MLDAYSLQVLTFIGNLTNGDYECRLCVIRNWKEMDIWWMEMDFRVTRKITRIRSETLCFSNSRFYKEHVDLTCYQDIPVHSSYINCFSICKYPYMAQNPQTILTKSPMNVCSQNLRWACVKHMVHQSRASYSMIHTLTTSYSLKPFIEIQWYNTNWYPMNRDAG